MCVYARSWWAPADPCCYGHGRHRVSQVHLFPSQEKGLHTASVNPKLNSCVLLVSTWEMYLTSELQRCKSAKFFLHQLKLCARNDTPDLPCMDTYKWQHRITSWACFMWWNSVASRVEEVTLISHSSFFCFEDLWTCQFVKSGETRH